VTVPLSAGAVVHAADVALEHAPVSPEQTLKGAPTVGEVALGEIAGATVGIWECTPGMSTDTEVDEVFVVLSGRAHIDFVKPELPSIDVRAGDVVRLEAGMRTVWTVTETLRKIYVA
jgi:uncharacterized cupin superfamily protein